MVNDFCAFRGCLTAPENLRYGFLKDSARDVFATLSEDEIAACLEVVEKMRAAKKKTEEIETAKARILSEVNKSLDKIGIEETKRIIREINRNLRYGD